MGKLNAKEIIVISGTCNECILWNNKINACENHGSCWLKKGEIYAHPEKNISEDNINSPKHYKLPGLNIESIDIIRVILGKYFKWFCLGNIIKYILRAEKKNGLEDYKKARKYLDWLIEGEENEN